MNATFQIEPTPDAIDPLTGTPTGEYDVVMLCDDGVWDWIGTFASRQEAAVELRQIKGDDAAGTERQYWAHAL